MVLGATDYFVRQYFQPVVGAAGLPRVRFHDLRHTFATLKLSIKQPVKIVSEMMGHTRTAITQDLYTHVSAQMQRQAAAAMDALLANAEPVAGGVAGGEEFGEQRRHRVVTAQVPLTCGNA